MDEKLIRIIDEQKDEIIDSIKQVLRYDTVKTEAQENAPFGVGCAQCLDYVLDLCASKGFETFNADYYAGHADYGDGAQICGVLGHLDVVPANEDTWVYPPFSATEKDGRIYARGALDDKTPMIAVLYAVEALKKAGYVFNKKVRLIFGCDEESGMSCIRHYFTKVAPPDFAFSPDANFPLINREKGILHLFVDCGELSPNILDINAGERPNVVIDKCTALLCEQGQRQEIVTTGKSAHASQPENGINASYEMFEMLSTKYNDDVCKKVFDTLCDYTGKKCNCALSDEQSGPLTLNIGVVRVNNRRLGIVLDIRHPVTYTCEQVIDALIKGIEDKTQFKVEVLSKSAPLFVPEDSTLVQKLLSAYSNATGEEAYPIAIGGGTYSRCMSNCVAFGPEFPGEEALIHQPNEYVSIEGIMKMTKVYAEAIRLLCCE